MRVCSRAPWLHGAFPRFSATTSPSDSRPDASSRLLIPGESCRTRRLSERVSQFCGSSFSTRPLLSLRPVRQILRFVASLPVAGFPLLGGLATRCWFHEAVTSSPLSGLGLALSLSESSPLPWPGLSRPQRFARSVASPRRRAIRCCTNNFHHRYFSIDQNYRISLA